MSHDHISDDAPRLLTQGNKKVGKKTLLWSLPAVKTCPGATDVCARGCSALHGNTAASMHQDGKYAANLEASKRPDFVPNIVKEITDKNGELMKPHVSGDLYSVEYCHKWLEICLAHPTVMFWLYTHSWRSTEMLNAIVDLANLPNVQLWFSCDKDSGEPPTVDGIKKAWTQFGDEEPPYPVDLIFRAKGDKRKPVRKINGVLVCPYENGHPEDKHLTCETCQFCFREKLAKLRQPKTDEFDVSTKSVAELQQLGLAMLDKSVESYLMAGRAFQELQSRKDGQWSDFIAAHEKQSSDIYEAIKFYARAMLLFGSIPKALECLKGKSKYRCKIVLGVRKEKATAAPVTTAASDISDPVEPISTAPFTAPGGDVIDNINLRLELLKSEGREWSVADCDRLQRTTQLASDLENQIPQEIWEAWESR